MKDKNLQIFYIEKIKQKRSAWSKTNIFTSSDSRQGEDNHPHFLKSDLIPPCMEKY